MVQPLRHQNNLLESAAFPCAYFDRLAQSFYGAVSNLVHCFITRFFCAICTVHDHFISPSHFSQHCATRFMPGGVYTPPSQAVQYIFASFSQSSHNGACSTGRAIQSPHLACIRAECARLLTKQRRCLRFRVNNQTKCECAGKELVALQSSCRP